MITCMYERVIDKRQRVRIRERKIEREKDQRGERKPKHQLSN